MRPPPTLIKKTGKLLLPSPCMNTDFLSLAVARAARIHSLGELGTRGGSAVYA